MAVVALTIGREQKLGQKLEDDAEENALLGLVKKDGSADDAPPALPFYLDGVSNLLAVKRWDHGQSELITIGDVEELMKHPGWKEKDGRVCLRKLQEMLMMVMDPPCTTEEVDSLFASVLVEGDYNDSFIYPKELYDILHSSDNEAFMKKRQEKDQKVTRDEFVHEVARMVDRDDAFMTLPLTIVYLAIFVYLIQGHLRIYERRSMENAMEEFINGRDPRETADENIDDIDSLWEWIVEAGLRGPLGNVKNSTIKGTTGEFYRQCIMASRNTLIGDVKLSKITYDGVETSAWLLNSEKGQEHLEANPYDYQAAAVKAAEDLKANGWESGDIKSMWMSFSSYNEYTRMFATTNVYVPLPKLGNVYSRIDCSAVSVEAYPSVDLYVADSLFLCLAMWIGIQETKDAFAALRHGCDEFRDYLAFWNCVDWANIFLAILAGAAWLETISCMIDESFNEIISADYKITADVMKIDAPRMDIITDRIVALRMRYTIVQIIMALNTIFVVAKFFKSFQSNARLKVVSTTFKQATIDLCHFAIMFSSIYLPFVLIGHILFGSDITEFASMTAAINTGIMCLMGDFAWYAEDGYPTHFSAVLPSGMPKMVLMLWYVAFMFLVFLVLLNMLLAVILEHYANVSSNVQYEVDAPAVWNQAIRYWKFTKETKGFISLEVLRQDLENDDDIADEKPTSHPDPSVTVNSLLKAWDGMAPAQAAWIMELLDRNSTDSAAAQEKRAKADNIKHLAEENRNRLNTVCEDIMESKTRMDQLEKVQGGGASDMSMGLQKLADIVTDLNVSVAKVRKEHDRLAVKVDDIVQAIPDGHRLELVVGSPLEKDKTVSSGKVAREWKKGATAEKVGGSAPSGTSSAPSSSTRPAAAASGEKLNKFGSGASATSERGQEKRAESKR